MRVLFSAAVAITAFIVSASASEAKLLVEIDKTSQQMVVSVDGVQRYAWPVSTGAEGYSTPTGDYKPFRMEVDHFSKEWDDAPMPHSIFFTQKGHAIHGSYDVKRLGRNVSHGCVRLAPENAARLFAMVKQEGLGNTEVVVSGSDPLPPPAVSSVTKPDTKPAPQQRTAQRPPEQRYVERDDPYPYANAYPPRPPAPVYVYPPYGGGYAAPYQGYYYQPRPAPGWGGGYYYQPPPRYSGW